jgi:hypothetical protein
VALLGTGTFSLDVALRHLFGRAAVTTPPSVRAGVTPRPD